MSQLSVVVIGTDDEHRLVLQMQVDATAVAKTVQAHSLFPIASTDPAIRRIRDAAPSVILIDMPRHSSDEALRAIDLIRNEIPRSPIFAVGDVNQPQVIISAMRSGAREFLERPTSTNALLEAFVRLTSAQRTQRNDSERGKIFTFVNAKGGCGATTLSVNTAVLLHARAGSTVLVDLAPLGHAALHLNVKPSFTIADALRNVQRLDYELMQSFLTPCSEGLQLLAGVIEPLSHDLLTTELAQLLDVLVSQFKHIVVDASSRLDAPLKLASDLSEKVVIVAQSDVTSLWSAAKVQEYLSQGISNSNRLQLVINRFRKIPGFSDSEIETVTRLRFAHRVPNQYAAVSASIERGQPVAEVNHSEVSRALDDLVSSLLPTVERTRPKARPFSIFR